MARMRLMLVDDHTLVRAGLKALIDRQSDMEVVAEADNAVEALNRAGGSRAEVLVLDLNIPGGGSLELIGKLQELMPPPRVLVLTMHDDTAYARSALAAGALGYVVKTISEQDLLMAVRAVQRGQVFVDLDDAAKTAHVFARVGAARTKNPAAIRKLSERELEVLHLLGLGHTNQAVAAQLDISPKTVASYRARIAEKLGLKTTADFVRYAVDMKPLCK